MERLPLFNPASAALARGPRLTFRASLALAAGVLLTLHLLFNFVFGPPWQVELIFTVAALVAASRWDHVTPARVAALSVVAAVTYVIDQVVLYEIAASILNWPAQMSASVTSAGLLGAAGYGVVAGVVVALLLPDARRRWAQQTLDRRTAACLLAALVAVWNLVGMASYDEPTGWGHVSALSDETSTEDLVALAGEGSPEGEDELPDAEPPPMTPQEQCVAVVTDFLGQVPDALRDGYGRGVDTEQIVVEYGYQAPETQAIMSLQPRLIADIRSFGRPETQLAAILNQVPSYCGAS